METTRAIPDPAERPTISVREAAAALGLGVNQAYAAIERGEVPALRIGRRVLVPTAALRALVGLDAA